MYLFRGGSPLKSIHKSPEDKDVFKQKQSKAAPHEGTSATAKLPGIKRRFAGTSSSPSLSDWQRKHDAEPERTHGRFGPARMSPAPDWLRVLLKDETEAIQAGRQFANSPPNVLSSPMLLSQATSLGGTSPGGRRSPPGIGKPRSPAVFSDAGRSTLFITPRPASTTTGRADGSKLFSSSDLLIQSSARPQSRNSNPSTPSGIKKFPSFKSANSKLSLKTALELQKEYEDSIHPCLQTLKKSWNNFELFREYAAGTDDPKQGIQVKHLTERKEMLDFSELLDLLRSLQLLGGRDGIVFNPLTQITITRVHEIFLEVNKKEWLQFVSTSGYDGQANIDQCSFEEYTLCMLCIAQTLGVPLEEVVPKQSSLQPYVSREELFKEVITMTEKARMKGVENKPGTEQFLQRSLKQDQIQLAFKNVRAARQSCDREEFSQARAQVQFASTTFMQNLRPDLMCEIRLVNEHIAREENNVIARKKKAQVFVEHELKVANRLSKELRVDEAKTQISKAMKMSEEARLPMKGTLRCCFRESEECLEQGVRAIEGDKNLAIAWRVLQRDELRDARTAVQHAKEFYKGNNMRVAALQSFDEALDKKMSHEAERKRRGQGIMELAREHIKAQNFDAAQQSIDEARDVYMEWTIPIGRNQSLTEQTTNLFKSIWKHEKLYNSFCAFDLDNLSGAGARAMLMDFNELLQLLRSLGILSERKIEVDEEHHEVHGPLRKMARSRSLALEMRQLLIEECTSMEIRKSEKVKIAKADVYTEFRAVNKMSMTDLAQGNLDADDDMSSLDWGEYQILMMRIARILDVPVTDVGCSPLFAKDIERVDLLQEELAHAKREYQNGIVLAGEQFLASSRSAIQDKRFDDAISDVHKAEEVFKRVWEEKVQNFQLASCARQLESIQKERVRETHRRADQNLQGEAALAKACRLLDEFVQQGALFDDHKFTIIEKEAQAAQKFFKSAVCFSKDLKQRIGKVLSRTMQCRDKIVSLRQGVSQGNTNIEHARTLIDDLTHHFGLGRSLSVSGRTNSVSSRDGSRQSTPALAHQHSPFEKPLQLLIEAQELFIEAKVTTEFKDLTEACEWLLSIAVERKIKLVQEAIERVHASKTALLEAEVAQNVSAEQVWACFENARKKLALAKASFRRASFSDLVLQYQREDPDLFVVRKIMQQTSGSESLRTEESIPSPKLSPDLKLDGTQICQELEDDILAKEEAWVKRHDDEVAEAFKCVDMCNEAIAKKAFNRANECFKRASELFKHTNGDTLEATRKTLNQAELKDRTLSKQIKGEAKSKSENAKAAIAQSNLEHAVLLADEALEMCHRCEDQDLLVAAESIKSAAVSVAKETYSVSISKLEENISGAKMAIEKKAFEEATALIDAGFDILNTEKTKAAIRALKYVDPFQNYPTLQEQLEDLKAETVAKERTYDAHKVFELKQGILRMEHAEALVLNSQPGSIGRRNLEDLVDFLNEIVELVEHDEEANTRLNALHTRVALLIKSQADDDQLRLKRAAGLLQYAETAARYGKFFDVIRDVHSAHAHLIEAHVPDNEFSKGQMMLQTAIASGRQKLAAKRAEFNRQTMKALKAFEDDKFQLAIKAADNCRSCLWECVDHQLVSATFQPFTHSYVDWMIWAETSAREISKFCEITHALIHCRILSLHSLPNFDTLTASECSSHYHPVYPTSSFYKGADMMIHVRDDNNVVIAFDGHFEQSDNDGMGTHAVSPSDALKILEGKGEYALSTGGAAVGAAIDELQVLHIDWTLISVKALETLDRQVRAQTQQEIASELDEELFEYKDEHNQDMDEAKELTEPEPECTEVSSQGAGASVSVILSQNDKTPASSRTSTAPHTPTTPILILVGTDTTPENDVNGKADSLQTGKNVQTQKEIAEILIASIVSHDFEESHSNIRELAALSDIEGVESLLLKVASDKDCAIEVVNFILEQRFNVRALDEELRNVLHVAAMNDRNDIIEEVAASSQEGGDDSNRDAMALDELLCFLLESRDKQGNRPVDVALDNKCAKALGTLVSLGANTWVLGFDGFNCLHRAIMQGYDEEVRLVIDSMKDIECKTARGMSPLMLACSIGNIQSATLLLSRGASANFSDRNGRTPLHLVAHAGNHDLVGVLLDYGANPDALNTSGESAAYCSIIQGHASCLQLLIQKKADLNLTVHGHTLLYTAAHHGRGDVVQMMVGIDCNLFPAAESVSEFAPLHAAVSMGHSIVVEALIKAHARVGSADSYARLHRVAECLAIVKKHTDVLDLLQQFPPRDGITFDDVEACSWDPEKLATILCQEHLLRILRGKHKRRGSDSSHPSIPAVGGGGFPSQPAGHTATGQIADDAYKKVQSDQNDDDASSQPRPALATTDLPRPASRSKEAAHASCDGSCNVIPIPQYHPEEDTIEIVSGIMNMLFSMNSNAIDIASACMAQHVRLVEHADSSPALEDTLPSYSDIIKELTGESPDSEHHPDDQVAIVELDEHLVRQCYPIPPEPTSERFSIATGANTARIELPEDVESRLLEENEKLNHFIRQTQEGVLERRRFTAANMRVLLKRALLASMSRSEDAAFEFLKEAETCFGQCSVCVHLRDQTMFTSQLCQVCELSKNVHEKTRRTVVSTLFSLNIHQTEQHLAVGNTLEASHFIKLARKWLDDLLGDCTVLATEKKAQKSLCLQVENRCILAEVTDHMEHVLQNVCAQDASRRSKLARWKFSQNMSTLTTLTMDLLSAFGCHDCSPAEMSKRIEDVKALRLEYMRASDLVSQAGFLALQNIATVISGISILSHAWKLMSIASDQVEKMQGFSLCFARQCVFECAGICAGSRESFKTLLDASQTGNTQVDSSCEDANVPPESRVSDMALLNVSGNIRAMYIKVGTEVMDELESRCRSVAVEIEQNEASFLEQKMKESLSCIATDIERDTALAKTREVETQMEMFERDARQQFEISEYGNCLESIACWQRVCDTGGLSRKKIEDAFNILNLADKAHRLRSKQAHAEMKLSEAVGLLQANVDAAKEPLAEAQIEFKEIHEQRPAILKQVAELSHSIVSHFVKSIVEVDMIFAAITMSEERSLEAAVEDLVSCTFKARRALGKDDLAGCIELAGMALASFKDRIAVLSIDQGNNSAVEEMEEICAEARDLLAMDAAAARAEEELASARSVYTGANFEEARGILLRAQQSAQEATDKRMKMDVLEELNNFDMQLHSDEIASVWSHVVIQIETLHDSQLSGEIRAQIHEAVIKAGAALSELCRGPWNQKPGVSWRKTGVDQPDSGVEIKNEGLVEALKSKTEFSREELDDMLLSWLNDECYIKVDQVYYAGKPRPNAALPTRMDFEKVSSSLHDAIRSAKMRARHLTHAPTTDTLWLPALQLSEECIHLSMCAQARYCADGCLAMIKAYQSRLSKRLGTQELIIAKDRLRAAHESSPAGGYSEVYVLPESCGIRVETVQALLLQCDRETEIAVNWTKQSIMASVEKQEDAAKAVLSNDFVRCEELLPQVVALDMVMTPPFWERHDQIKTVAQAMRRQYDLDVLGREQHDHALQLIQNEIFDTARDVAAKSLETKRLHERASIETHRLVSELRQAPAVHVPVEMPPDDAVSHRD